MKNIDYSHWPETVYALKEQFPIFAQFPNRALELLWNEWAEKKLHSAFEVYTIDLGVQFYLWLFEEEV